MARYALFCLFLIAFAVCQYSGEWELNRDQTTCSFRSVPTFVDAFSCDNHFIAYSKTAGPLASFIDDNQISFITENAFGLPVHCRGIFSDTGSVLGECFGVNVLCKFEYNMKSTCDYNNVTNIKGYYERTSFNGVCPRIYFPEGLALFQCGPTVLMLSNNINGEPAIGYLEGNQLSFEMYGANCTATVDYPYISGDCPHCATFEYRLNQSCE